MTNDLPQGPPRWERAAKNWAAKPLSQAAALYTLRLGLGAHFEKVCAEKYGWIDDGIFAHVQLREDGTTKLEGWTCSARHAAMRLALDNSTLDRPTIYGKFPKNRENHWRPERKTHDRFVEHRLPKRDTSCSVCGCSISTEGELGEPTVNLTPVRERVFDLAASDVPLSDTKLGYTSEELKTLLGIVTPLEQFSQETMVDGTGNTVSDVYKLEFNSKRKWKLWCLADNETRAGVARRHGEKVL